MDRTVGTMLGYEVTKRYGGQGLPDDTIRITFTGSAGQSFGAFVPRGMTMTLVGDANDGFGKGLSGGRLAVFPPKASHLQVRAEHHRRQRRVLWRDERRGVRQRRGGRALLRPQQRRDRGRRGRRRSRLRVHDRWPRRRARQDRAQLRRRHERRRGLRARRGRRVRAALQPRHGGPGDAGRRPTRSAAAGPDHEARPGSPAARMWKACCRTGPGCSAAS